MVHLTSTSEERLTDRQLDDCIAKIAEGDREALAVLYEATRVAVYAYAMSILKNSHDAEDVLQDCYLSVASAADSYVSRGKPMAWLLTIAKNRCVQLLREHQRQGDPLRDDWEDVLPQTASVSNEDRLLLSYCMSELSEQERKVVVLHATAGFKHREIAAMLGIPLSTVLSKYHRAMKKLKRIIAEGGD